MSTRMITLESIVEDLRKARRKLGKANHSEPVYFTKTGLDLLLKAIDHRSSSQPVPTANVLPRFTEPYSHEEADANLEASIDIDLGKVEG